MAGEQCLEQGLSGLQLLGEEAEGTSVGEGKEEADDELEGLDILQAALRVLREADPHRKAALTVRIAQLWQQGKVPLPAQGAQREAPPDRPARDETKVGHSKRVATLQLYLDLGHSSGRAGSMRCLFAAPGKRRRLYAGRAELGCHVQAAARPAGGGSGQPFSGWSHSGMGGSGCVLPSCMHRAHLQEQAADVPASIGCWHAPWQA